MLIILFSFPTRIPEGVREILRNFWHLGATDFLTIEVIAAQMCYKRPEESSLPENTATLLFSLGFYDPISQRRE